MDMETEISYIIRSGYAAEIISCARAKNSFCTSVRGLHIKACACVPSDLERKSPWCKQCGEELGTCFYETSHTLNLTGRLHGPIVGPTGRSDPGYVRLSDQSDRPVGQTVAEPPT